MESLRSTNKVDDHDHHRAFAGSFVGGQLCLSARELRDRGVGHGRGDVSHFPLHGCDGSLPGSTSSHQTMVMSVSGTIPSNERILSGCKRRIDENRGRSSGEGLARTSADKHRGSSLYRKAG